MLSALFVSHPESVEFHGGFGDIFHNIGDDPVFGRAVHEERLRIERHRFQRRLQRVRDHALDLHETSDILEGLNPNLSLGFRRAKFQKNTYKLESLPGSIRSIKPY